MPTVIVTGANRGIGLELARQYQAEGWRVIGTARRPEQAAELRATGAELRALDTGNANSIYAFAHGFGVQPIDLLINNAGIMGPDQPRQSRDGIDAEGWAETMRVNALGPVLVTLALKENLARSANPRAVTISTALGSIADNTSGGLYAYRMSKAAVNMGNRGLAADLRDRRICCVVLHPGWVQTDMGGAQAPVSPADSVAGIRRVVAGLTLEHSGRFFAHDGAELAW